MVWGFLIRYKQLIPNAFHPVGFKSALQIRILQRLACKQTVFVRFIAPTNSFYTTDAQNGTIAKRMVGVCCIKGHIARTRIVDNNSTIAFIGDIHRIAWEIQLVVLRKVEV